jgi:hypothetical protein
MEEKPVDTAKKIRSTLQSRKDSATFYMKNRSTVLEKRKAAYNASKGPAAPQYVEVEPQSASFDCSFH